MLARLPNRTGATVRIATATAIWAKTAALTGACRRSQAGLLHELLGQVHDPRPNPIREHVPDQGEVLRGHSVFAVLFEREPEVSEPSEGIFIKTADRMRKGNEPAAQIDRIGRGNLPILAPVAVEDLLGDIGMDQRAQ